MSSTLPPTPTDGIEWTWEIATLYPPQGRWTEAEYLELTDSLNRLIEFTDGRLEFLTMPTIEHQLIVKFLFRAFDAFVESRQLGMVLFAVLRVNLRAGKYREPVIVYTAKENVAAQDDRYLRSSDLVIELVSPDQSSHKRDYETKVADYAAAGIPEYWIVDPQEQKITVLALNGEKYAEHCVARPGEVATSKLLDGFSVAAAAVFEAGRKR